MMVVFVFTVRGRKIGIITVKTVNYNLNVSDNIEKSLENYGVHIDFSNRHRKVLNLPA